MILNGIRVRANIENRMAAEKRSVKLAFPIMGGFVTVRKIQLYAVCVKTRHLYELRHVKKRSWGPCKGGLEGFYTQQLPKA